MFVYICIYIYILSGNPHFQAAPICPCWSPTLHPLFSEVPSDVIVDASMAAAVRDAGRMWTKERGSAHVPCRVVGATRRSRRKKWMFYDV